VSDWDALQLTFFPEVRHLSESSAPKAVLSLLCASSRRLWRPTFPYPVHFEHLEFNQLAMVRTIFEDHTVNVLERYFEPVPEVAEEWVNRTDFSELREEVQTRRRISDEEFFHRFAPEVPVPSNKSSWDRCKAWIEQHFT
jgi:hypothetical protein